VYFQQVRRKILRSKSVKELRDLVDQIDEDFQADYSVMTEHDWPVLTSLVTRRKDELENNKPTLKLVK